MSTQTTNDIGRFFARWAESYDEVGAAFRESFAEGAEWHAGPPPIPVTHGAEEALGLMQNFNQQYDLATIDVDVLSIAEVDGVVYTERIDHLVDSKGKRFLSIPLAGVMHLDGNGKITYWRDYWDMQEFMALAPAS